MWSGRRPPDPPAPHPRRGCPIAHTTLGPRGTQRAAPAATAWRNEGRGAAGPPPPPHPHPPSRAHPPRRPREPGREPPGRATPGPADAPSSARPSRPPQRGGGRRAARTRRPARGRQTGDPTRARESASERGARRGGLVGGWGGSRALPLAQPATTSADRRRQRQSGQRIGAAAGPGKRDTPGRGPRGAADGERTEADGRTERGTDGVRPRDTNATEPAVEAGVAARHREGDGSKRPGGSESAARAHRGISPPEASQHRGGPEAHPERQTGLSGHPPPRGGEGAHPSRGLTPTANPTPGAAAGPGERSPAAYQRPPQPSHGQPCCARQGSPLPRLPLRAPRALLHPGTPPADGGRETTPT